MADEIKDAAPQADAEPTPQAGADAKPEAEGDLSQADVAALKAELQKTRREAAQYRTRAKEFEEKEQRAQEASLSELEKAQKKAAELEAQLQATQAEVWREKAAAKAKLPPELAARITGKTLEEMETDADNLAKVILKSAPPPTGVVQPTNPGKDEKRALAAVKNAPVDIFDPTFVAGLGGGAFSTDKE